MPRGDIVLVPFPFTDLSTQKRRPALVVSPDGFDVDDLILCAITSRVVGRAGQWDIRLDSDDVAGGQLPRPSMIRAGKLFTMHQWLILGRFGSVRPIKLLEVLTTMQRLFGA